jgi:UDP-N-acetylmuramate dehydrogenase
MSLTEKLSSIDNLKVFFNCDLSTYTTFRMKSVGDLAIVGSKDALQELLKALKTQSRSWRMIGWGANQVLNEIETDFLIKLDFEIDKYFFDSIHDEYELPASTGLNVLTAHAAKFGLKGWEVFTGIPASLGGAIFMNAGTALGEIGEIVKSVTVMKEDGTIRKVAIDKSSFGYRCNHFLKNGEVVISATLIYHGIDESLGSKIKDYLQYRKQTQPLASKNCGCVFKNYDSVFKAGLLLDITGLKGLTVGALSVSHVHANFMENSKNATANDFKQLTNIINQQMRLHWGVEFELEVKAV